jgi:hypothetical protein
VDITFDDETNLHAMQPSMNKVGIRTIYLAAGVKNKIVEKMIQEARAIIRCIRASRRYEIPRNLDCELWIAAAHHLANTPNKTNGPQTTPFFLMTGRRPNSERLESYIHPEFMIHQSDPNGEYSSELIRNMNQVLEYSSLPEDWYIQGESSCHRKRDRHREDMLTE